MFAAGDSLHLEIFEEAHFEACDEVKYLEEAIGIIPDIKDELQSTFEAVRKLSIKQERQTQNYLCTLSPGTSWTYPEYFNYNVDALINEQRRKHDLSSPQQHHKVQEINDDSSASSPSTSPCGIINHSSEVSEDLEFKVDWGAGGDKESTDEGGFRTREEFWRSYAKIEMVKIKLKSELQRAIISVQRMTNMCKIQMEPHNQIIKKETSKSPSRVKFSPRRHSSASLSVTSKFNVDESHQRPVSEIVKAFEARSINSN
jgi:hypothetical protein